MPLFHVHGLVASTLSTLLSGGTVVVPAKFNPLSFWRTVRDSGVTWYSAVPTIHHLLLSRAGDERPAGAKGLRFIRSCSAALPPEMMAKMEQVFGAPVLEAYGMTEASHQMCSNPLPPAARKAGLGRAGNRRQGRASWMRRAIILPTGERGEVVIQGPNVVDGYENNPEANAASFTNGWFRTGDQGFLDADGYLTLTGRIKELINRGGEKIAPREIDEVLLAHPAVAEAVAFGVPHATWGEEVAAAVVLDASRNSEAAILAYCKERLADFKRPKKMYIVETIPRTATGKIQRGAVAQGSGTGVAVRMKFLIAGAGAIGGYIGAKLARAGEDVTLFARGPHLARDAANAACACISARRGRFRSASARHRQSGRSRPGRRDLPGREGARLDAARAADQAADRREHHRRQHAERRPWWYFQFGRRRSSPACISNASIPAA